MSLLGKEADAFMKEAAVLIERGEASEDVKRMYLILELFKEEARFKHGQRIKMGKAQSKAKREQAEIEQKEGKLNNERA